ncbi:porin [Pararhizobium antarcticum]|uniref:Porin n=1 Tax=Pararhizobium antarcticum TaxID=1798805 RepID=A0A657LPY2_9HYPH|nr:porin [Pararhizobium antarcticum]OJF94437.1 hypothetical protein AX760_20160 [Pararhizobium antarcticum]
MNIKSLLLGSAAALAAVSGANAADAIVAAEPEPMEYVRVCDAFGTGYFYIPGTETCLKIGGYVRTQINYDEDLTVNGADWDARTRGYLTFAAKNDTEYGTLSGYINLQADDTNDTFLDGAWINIAGFDVGYFYNWWDDMGLSGETDVSAGNLSNAIRYTYDGGTFKVGVAAEELAGNGTNDDVGVSGYVAGSIGGVTADLVASYDFDVEQFAVKGRLVAEIGPGALGILGVYADGANFFWDVSEWSVAAEYKIQATEKFFITPAAQYFGDFAFVDGNDAWKVGVTAGYQITEGLRTLATVNYLDVDNVADGEWTGFVRLQRDF